jgi:tRNA/tmRNA/rRNA uracil-C5-methylase (TrmA/RlmC/RlmD family)
MLLTETPGCNPVCKVCHYKELDYPAQLARKQAWAEKQLDAWNGVLKPIHPAPECERLAYRSKSWMRSHVEGGEVSFGMFRAVAGLAREDGWSQEFISWDRCPLHVQAIQKMTLKLKAALMESVPDFVKSALLGIWFGNPHVVIVAKELRLGELRGLPWGELLEAPFEHVWFHRTNQVGKTVFQHREFHRVAGAAAQAADTPILAFRQIAQTLLRQARGEAVQALLARRPKMILDLYCGTGELSALLPEDMGWLGIELSIDAVNFANTLGPMGRASHRAYAGTIEQRLRDARVRSAIVSPYALYLNPPRPGLSPEAEQEVRALIGQTRPESVVYLSCSASSLARDLRMFEAQGYRVASLQPYDFFPQTEHFETLAILGR